jgi:hypothetical protein
MYISEGGSQLLGSAAAGPSDLVLFPSRETLYKSKTPCFLLGNGIWYLITLNV